MTTFRYIVGDRHGIHARPAGALVSCAKGFVSDIVVEKNGKIADAKRLLSVMALGAKYGELLIFSINGIDEELAAAQLERCCHQNIG